MNYTIWVSIPVALWLLVFAVFDAKAHEFPMRCYAEFGAGWNPEGNVYETPLGKVVLGCVNDDDWAFEFEHISSVPDTEDQGLEVYWLNKRFYFF